MEANKILARQQPTPKNSKWLKRKINQPKKWHKTLEIQMK
jgi:hypothetical protein